MEEWFYLEKRSKDIYTVDVCKQCGFFSIRARKTSSFFWHCHLGHCSFDAGDFLKKKGDIEVGADCFSPTICSSCQLAKSTKLSFSKSIHRAVSPFSKISCDLWGPAPVVSNEGYKHYVLFVDDHTRFLWFYPICSKSDFFTAYLHLKANWMRDLTTTKMFSVRWWRWIHSTKISESSIW